MVDDCGFSLDKTVNKRGESASGAVLAWLIGSGKQSPQEEQRTITMLGKLDRGAGTVTYELADDGIVNASMVGLVVPANAGELSAMLLRAGSVRSATGVLCSVQKALIAIPPINPMHYSYVPPELRNVPVAVVLSPEQVGVYEHIAQAAALAGTIRRAFLSREEAHEWIREQARALAANRVWWSAPGSLR
jgi:hypothetical protein